MILFRVSPYLFAELVGHDASFLTWTFVLFLSMTVAMVADFLFKKV
jgi:hypothetical protein